MEAQFVPETGERDLPHALADGQIGDKGLYEFFPARRRNLRHVEDEHFPAVHTHAERLARHISAERHIKPVITAVSARPFLFEVHEVDSGIALVF